MPRAECCTSKPIIGTCVTPQRDANIVLGNYQSPKQEGTGTSMAPFARPFRSPEDLDNERMSCFRPCHQLLPITPTNCSLIAHSGLPGAVPVPALALEPVPPPPVSAPA